MILLYLYESFSPVHSALITCKEEPMLMEIITAVKEHEAHTAMTNCLLKETVEAMKLVAKHILCREAMEARGSMKVSIKGRG